MQLTLSIACDDARTRPDGKLDITGIFNELSAEGFPAMQDRMTVVFTLEWAHEESGEIPLRADLKDDDGQVVLTIEGATEVDRRPRDRPPAQTRLILPLERVVFPHAGRYTFELTAGQDTVRALSLYVLGP